MGVGTFGTIRGVMACLAPNADFMQRTPPPQGAHAQRSPYARFALAAVAAVDALVTVSAVDAVADE